MSKFYTKIRTKEIENLSYFEPATIGNCVGSYTFDNVDSLGTDSSGFSRNGTVVAITSAVNITDGAKSREASGDFTGGSKNLNLNAYASHFTYSSLSISFWFKVSALGTGLIMLNINQGGTVNRLEVTSNSNKFKFTMTTSSTLNISGESSGTYVDNLWHHAILIFDAVNGNKLYIDTVQNTVAYTTGSSTITTNLSNFSAVATSASIGSEFTGYLDSFAFFNKVLSTSEISKLYTESNSIFTSAKTNKIVNKLGTLNNPSYTFENYENTGTFLSSNDEMNVSINGVKAGSYINKNTILPFTDPKLADYYDFEDADNLGNSNFTIVDPTNLTSVLGSVTQTASVNDGGKTITKVATFTHVANQYLYTTSLGKTMTALVSGLSFSVCFWLYSNVYNGTGHGIFYLTNDTDSVALSIGATRNITTDKIRFEIGTGLAQLVTAEETSLPSVNTWNHYAFVISSAGNKLYKNGVLLTSGGGRTNITGTESTIHVPVPGITRMYIGRWSTYPSLGGSIKNLIFSSTAWTDTNVSDIYSYSTDSIVGPTSTLSSKFMMLNDNKSGLLYNNTNNLGINVGDVQKINIKSADTTFNNTIISSEMVLSNSTYLPFTDSGLTDYYEFNDSTNLGLSGTSVNSTNLINQGGVSSIESITDVNSRILYKPGAFALGDTGGLDIGYLYNTSLTGKAVKTLFNQTAGITISFWDYYTTYTFNPQSGIFTADTGSGASQFSLSRRASDGRLNIYVDSAAPHISENPVPSINTWNFYVVQFGSFGYRLYRNGIELTVANSGIVLHAGTMSTAYTAKDITRIYIGSWINNDGAGPMAKYLKNFTITSTLWSDEQIQNVYNHQGKVVKGSLSGKQVSLTGTGNTLPALSSLYIAPITTTFSGSNNYYFNYLNTPATTGSTTGTASTLYIKGAPSGATTAYALNVNSGDVRMGGGLSILGGGVQYYSRFSAVTSYTMTKDDYTVIFSSETNVTVTLPLAASHTGRQYIIVKSSTAGAGQITITRSGSDFIDGSLTTLTLTDQYDRASVVSDGVSIWYTV